MINNKLVMSMMVVFAALFFAAAFVVNSAVLSSSQGRYSLLLGFMATLLFVCLAGLLSLIALRVYVHRVLNSISVRVRKISKESEQVLVSQNSSLIQNNQRLCSEVREMSKAQQNVHEFLKREGSVQIVLDRLLAAEARVSASIESTSLTISEEVRKQLEDSEQCNGSQVRSLKNDLAPQAENIAAFGSSIDSKLTEMVALHERFEREMRGRFSEVEASVREILSGTTGLTEVSTQVATKIAANSQLLLSTFRSESDPIRAAVRQIEIQLEKNTDTSKSNVHETSRLSSAMDEQLHQLSGYIENLEASAKLNFEGIGFELNTVEEKARSFEREVSRSLASMETTLETLLAQVNEESAESNANSQADGLFVKFESLRNTIVEFESLVLGRADILIERIDTANENEDGSGAKTAEMHARLVELVDQVNTSQASNSEAIMATSHDLSTRVETKIQSLTELAQTTQRLTDSAKNDVKALYRHIDRSSIDTVRQLESLLQLLSRVDTSDRRFPQSGGFAMNPDSLLLLSDLIIREQPSRILELGSGTSTVWLGKFANAIGAEVVSIDHLDKYYSLTQQMLSDFKLQSTVDLRLAPLSNSQAPGLDQAWYDHSVFADIDRIDMLVVDGPPESTGPSARCPAFTALRDQLASDAIIIVDDVHREDESEMVEAWIAQDSDLTWIDCGVGRTGVLRYRRGSD